MRNNVLISLLCNMIVIFVALYYIPFLGVFLIIIRYIIYYSDNRKNTTSSYLLVLGAMLLMPKLIKFVSDKISYSLDNVPYFNKLIESNIYNVNVVNPLLARDTGIFSLHEFTSICLVELLNVILFTS